MGLSITVFSIPNFEWIGSLIGEISKIANSLKELALFMPYKLFACICGSMWHIGIIKKREDGKLYDNILKECNKNAEPGMKHLVDNDKGKWKLSKGEHTINFKEYGRIKIDIQKDKLILSIWRFWWNKARVAIMMDKFIKAKVITDLIEDPEISIYSIEDNKWSKPVIRKCFNINQPEKKFGNIILDLDSYFRIRNYYIKTYLFPDCQRLYMIGSKYKMSIYQFNFAFPKLYDFHINTLVSKIKSNSIVMINNIDQQLSRINTDKNYVTKEVGVMNLFNNTIPYNDKVIIGITISNMIYMKSYHSDILEKITKIDIE
jgi:hypothetical protein